MKNKVGYRQKRHRFSIDIRVYGAHRRGDTQHGDQNLEYIQKRYRFSVGTRIWGVDRTGAGSTYRPGPGVHTKELQIQQGHWSL